jgi:amino acid adenylation domain-containing protein
VPFETIVEKIAPERTISHNPIFQVSFSLLNGMDKKIKLNNLNTNFYEVDSKKSKFDLSLFIEEIDQQMEVKAIYNSDIFKEETINRLLKHYKDLIKNILKNPNRDISNYEYIGINEQKQLLCDFNNTKVEYSTEMNICKMFKGHLRFNADKNAVVFGNNNLTFNDLDIKSNQFANYLVENGISHGNIVGVLVEPSFDMIIAMFAILKCGAAILPIDPDFPTKRIDYMLKDSEAVLLLTQKHLCKNLNIKTIFVDKDNIYSKDVSFQSYSFDNSTPCYIIYTSGTTGNPKGVIVKHSNLLNYVNWFINNVKLTSKDSSLLTSSFAFDLGYTSIFPVLLKGGTLHLVMKDTYMSPDKLLSYIDSNKITYIKMTPTLFSSVFKSPEYHLHEFNFLRLVILGGEKINVNDVERVCGDHPTIQFMNHYGPTETTIGTVAQMINLKKLDDYKIHPTIGKPISNCRIYILDNKSNLCGIGIPGEICVAGKGVSQGYINNEKLTKSRFVEDLFDKGYMYKTGDLGRWMSDGKIEFLGRIDGQIKIRGFRVELEEIKNYLLAINEINDAVVVVRHERDSLYICAYYVSDKDFTIEYIQEELKKDLPKYMIPQFIARLDRIPVNANNKIDYKSLPAPDTEAIVGKEDLNPENFIEKELQGLWCEMLSIKTVGTHSNFFSIGGHSLNALYLISKINSHFNSTITIKDFFMNPTISMIAKVIEGTILKKDRNAYYIFNNLNNEKLFCFPDIFGFGFIYKELAKFLKNNSIIAFDFINENDPISYYYEQIKKLKKKSPYKFIGYSAGGNIVFEIAKYFEMNGDKVSDIILIDSVFKNKRYDNFNISSERYIRNNLEKVIEDYELLTKDIKEEIILNAQRYYNFHSGLVNSGKVNSKIHLITSEELSKGYNYDLWREATNSKFIRYSGKGNHFNMLKHDQLIKNAKVIEDLLR